MLLCSVNNPSSRPLVSALLLMLVLLVVTGCGTQPGSNGAGLVPDDDLLRLLERLEPGEAPPNQGDLIRQMVLDSAPRFTERCQRFVDDMQEAYWGYPEDGEAGDREAFENKWRGVYDLEYAWFGHAFEEGNCGWAVKTVESLSYLGAGNNGDWYQLVVAGGCHERDSNHRLTRVLKLTDSGDSWLIDAIYALPTD